MTEPENNESGRDERVAKGSMTFSGRAILRIKSVLSPSYIQSAAYFCRCAHALETEHAGTPRRDMQEVIVRHRSYVIGAIHSSVAFLESTINEFLSDAVDNRDLVVDRLGSRDAEFLATLWEMDDVSQSMRMLSKFQIALSGTGREPIDKGTEPYQSVANVIWLRNELTHFKPEYLPRKPPKTEHPAERRLPKNLTPNLLFPASSGNPAWPGRILGHGCAEWATKSALSFADEFYERMGVDARYAAIRDKLRTD